MKLPQLIRKLVPLSIAVFVLSCIAFSFLIISPWPWLTAVAVVLAGISYFIFMGAATLVRIIENALLRRFGQPATATVLDFYGIKTGTSHGWTTYGGMRVKLEVHLPEGGSFEAVAEDSYNVGLQLREGGSVPVKYDPGTKEVALAMPRVTEEKVKEKNF
jgi:hypothetical protein